jgi:WD40 repeat protein
VTTGKEISRLAAVGNEGGLSVALNAAGTAIAAAGADGFWLWDLTAQPRQVIAERGGPAYAVAFGPDGRTVVTGRRGAGGAIVWDARSGRRTATLDRSGTANVHRVAVSPDGRHVATAGTEPVSSTFPVRIWDLRAPEAAVRTISVAFEPSAIRYSPDGRYLAVGGSNVLLFDLTSGR